MTSYTELIANPSSHHDPVKRQAMLQLKVLLNGVLEARGKVLVKLNVGGDRLAEVVAAGAVDEGADRVGARRSRVATPSRRWWPSREINTLIPALKDAGATDIIELPLAKIVH